MVLRSKNDLRKEYDLFINNLPELAEKIKILQLTDIHAGAFLNKKVLKVLSALQ
jgi:predicted MPP superfamily phosphohydrolase